MSEAYQEKRLTNNRYPKQEALRSYVCLFRARRPAPCTSSIKFRSYAGGMPYCCLRYSSTKDSLCVRLAKKKQSTVATTPLPRKNAELLLKGFIREKGGT